MESWQGVEHRTLQKRWELIGKYENGKLILKWGVLCGTLEEGTMVWFEKCYDGVESKYVGDIENRKPNGQGTYIFHDGRKYVGGWKDGKEHGQGTFTFSDGKKGVGEFREKKTLEHHNIRQRRKHQMEDGEWS